MRKDNGVRKERTALRNVDACTCHELHNRPRLDEERVNARNHDRLIDHMNLTCLPCLVPRERAAMQFHVIAVHHAESLGQCVEYLVRSLLNDLVPERIPPDVIIGKIERDCPFFRTGPFAQTRNAIVGLDTDTRNDRFGVERVLPPPAVANLLRFIQENRLKLDSAMHGKFIAWLRPLGDDDAFRHGMIELIDRHLGFGYGKIRATSRREPNVIRLRTADGGGIDRQLDPFCAIATARPCNRSGRTLVRLPIDIEGLVTRRTAKRKRHIHFSRVPAYSRIVKRDVRITAIAEVRVLHVHVIRVVPRRHLHNATRGGVFVEIADNGIMTIGTDNPQRTAILDLDHCPFAETHKRIRSYRERDAAWNVHIIHDDMFTRPNRIFREPSSLDVHHFDEVRRPVAGFKADKVTHRLIYLDVRNVKVANRDTAIARIGKAGAMHGNPNRKSGESIQFRTVVDRDVLCPIADPVPAHRSRLAGNAIRLRHPVDGERAVARTRNGYGNKRKPRCAECVGIVQRHFRKVSKRRTIHANVAVIRQRAGGHSDDTSILRLIFIAAQDDIVPIGADNPQRTAILDLDHRPFAEANDRIGRERQRNAAWDVHVPDDHMFARPYCIFGQASTLDVRHIGEVRRPVAGLETDEVAHRFVRLDVGRDELAQRDDAHRLAGRAAAEKRSAYRETFESGKCTVKRDNDILGTVSNAAPVHCAGCECNSVRLGHPIKGKCAVARTRHRHRDNGLASIDKRRRIAQ